MAKVIRLTENDVERLVKKILKEQVPGSRGIHLDDDTIEAIENGGVNLEPIEYTIEDYTLWVNEDDYETVKNRLGYGDRL